MKIRADQLARALERSLPTGLLITGDEPQQKLEALELALAFGRSAGMDERLRFEIDHGFDWSSLVGEWSAPSLFAPRRIFDLRLASLRLPKEAVTWLASAVNEPPGTNFLIVSAARLEAAQKKSAWVQAFEKHGLWLEVWPLKAGELMAWMERRLRSRGLEAGREALRLLAEQVEGNLLAAAQEIDKLALLFPRGRRLSEEDILGTVAHSSRHTIFELSDAVLHGDAKRALRVLHSLQGAGEDPVLLSWALTREIRLIADLATRLEHGETLAHAQKALKIRDPQIHPYAARARLGARRWQNLLSEAALLDRVAKGVAPGRPWPMLAELTLRACQNEENSG
ncbi:MAG: DNA polymerase III subunit delta [Halothiobacillaceae bacterium]